MFHIGFTPNTYPANAMSAKHETLMGAIAQLFNDLGLAYGPEEWFVARILEATKEAIDNLEDGSKPACGSWSDMGCEDDAFSINVFVDDSEAIYIQHDGKELLAPHGAVGFVLDKHCERWIYNEHEIDEWDNVMLISLPSDGPTHNGPTETGLVEETCEHTGMTRDELESLCGTPAITNPALEALRYHVTGAIERGEGVAITEQRADAKITELIRDVKDGDCALSAIFDDGSTRKLFNFYIDELAFHDADLIGKTEMQAHELKSQRDMNYIRS